MSESGFWKCVFGILMNGASIAVVATVGPGSIMLAVAMWAIGIYFCITGGADFGMDAAITEGER